MYRARTLLPVTPLVFATLRFMISDERIFVQIPAYRDPLLASTLDSLFEKADNPKRLRVRVCWQRAAHERLPKRLTRHESIELDDVDYRKSRGANWARRRLQRHWRGEPYTLIIDSHLRFANAWDKTLIGYVQQLKSTGVRKPIVTGYPPDFDPDTFPKGRSITPLKMYREAYIDALLVHFAGFKLPLWTQLKAPIPAQFLALGLLFAEGSFNAEIPLDPNIYFFGDEITTGLRAYCHGYDLFHPHRVVAWHAYDRRTRRCHWEDHQNWSKKDRRSLDRVRRVLLGQSNPRYPLGTQRTRASYERFIGMPLVQRDRA